VFRVAVGFEPVWVLIDEVVRCWYFMWFLFLP